MRVADKARKDVLNEPKFGSVWMVPFGLPTITLTVHDKYGTPVKLGAGEFLTYQNTLQNGLLVYQREVRYIRCGWYVYLHHGETKVLELVP